tara:strand:+ start:804 stop:1640 length:837 start_codon:yes stop_codon:yes gene_type:complete
MTNGVLLFAFNNNSIDYLKLAKLNAALVRKHLNIPVTLATDMKVNDSLFESVVYVDKSEPTTRVFKYRNNSNDVTSWFNKTRTDAYHLSPYDNTLLLDVDFLIFSNDLKKLFSTNVPFACYDSVHDITDTASFSGDTALNWNSIPMRWATVVYFTKDPIAKNIFSMMERVKLNYEYYAQLFNFNFTPYRNDYALSIALQVLGGFNSDRFHLPGKLSTLSTYDNIEHVNDDGSLVISYQKHHNENKNIGMSSIKGIDLHIMNKPTLLTHYDKLMQYASV